MEARTQSVRNGMQVILCMQTTMVTVKSTGATKQKATLVIIISLVTVHHGTPLASMPAPTGKALMLGHFSREYSKETTGKEVISSGVLTIISGGEPGSWNIKITSEQM